MKYAREGKARIVAKRQNGVFCPQTDSLWKHYRVWNVDMPDSHQHPPKSLLQAKEEEELGRQPVHPRVVDCQRLGRGKGFSLLTIGRIARVKDKM